MAEKGAHLAQTVQIKPSIFDFIAQESLNELLYPATKRVADVLSLRGYTYRELFKWFDEIYLISQFFLQLHYLKKYGATFSENFYGLQRFSINGVSNSKNVLSKRELVLSLIMVTLVPYLKLKLNSVAEKMYFEDLPACNKRKKVLFMKSVIAANSGVHISLQVINFVQHLQYLSGQSDFNSPLLWLAGVKLKYADEENQLEESFSFRSFIPQLLRRSFEVSAFFIQFYQWWQTEHVGSLGALPVPPPPDKSDDGKNYSDVCPICHKKRRAETALSVSGFVFCFTCIVKYLDKHSQCPVTKLPATINNLIRIYPPE